MFKNENIHPAVQKALYRKIDALNRLQLGTDVDFFRGNTLEPQDNSNPVEQHLYRNCFAKVSAAIVSSGNGDTIAAQPESLSSYFTIGENKTSQTNKPLTFRKSFAESTDNIFRGHTGITGIEANQLNFYTYKYTINFSCPDPIDFESRIQPTFLRHGQFIAIEFGWGIEEDSINIPPLSITDMQDLVDGVRERNLQAAGNYICDVGMVTNYDFKLESNGGYTGTIDVVTRGQNILNQTTPEADGDGDEVMMTYEGVIKDIKDLAANEATGSTEVKTTELANEQLDKLKEKSITYQATIRNLDKVIDGYLGERLTRNKNYKLQNVKKYEYLKNSADDLPSKPKLGGTLETQFKNGVMYYNMKTVGTSHIKIPDNLKKRYLISWGWFEDFILNSFFKATIKPKDGGTKTFQEIRSLFETVVVKDDPETEDVNEQTTIQVENKCHLDGDKGHICSFGLGSVVLPGKHQEKLTQWFDEDDKTLDKFDMEDKVKLMRVRHIYENIDNNFRQFQEGDKGIIRNMVFPIDMYRKHFENISTIRQGLQSFWAEVSNTYGNFWHFQLTQDQNNTGRIGIIDFLSEEKNEDDDPSLLANQSDRTTFKDYKFTPDKVDEQYQKMFTFPLYSKDGIVKEFGLSVKLTSKAATLVNYGTNTSILNGVGRTTDAKDLGLQAYAFLLKKDREQALLLNTDGGDPENQVDAVLHNLSYAVDKEGKGVGTDEEKYKLDNEQIRNLLEEKGIKFSEIDEINKDTESTLEKVRNQKVKQESGVGMYDENGNLVSYFKKKILYVINFSLHEGDNSNIQQTKPVIPIEIDMTLDGIGGLKPGDMFRVDYLPKVYRDFAYFQIFQVNHSMGTSGWETKINGKMKLDLIKMRKEGYVQTAPQREGDWFANYEKVLRELEETTSELPVEDGYELTEADEIRNKNEALAASQDALATGIGAFIGIGGGLGSRLASWFFSSRAKNAEKIAASRKQKRDRIAERNNRTRERYRSLADEHFTRDPSKSGSTNYYVNILKNNYDEDYTPKTIKGK